VSSAALDVAVRIELALVLAQAEWLPFAAAEPGVFGLVGFGPVWLEDAEIAAAALPWLDA